jgi:S-adenosylmethionine:tRNA ribosyltransferase-isomerase
MRAADFDFVLPVELIAQTPAPRGASRLLVLERDSGRRIFGTVQDLPAHLASGDLLVVNNTRVYPARLLGRRVPSGGAVECLLLQRLDTRGWEALVHPGQKLRPGARVVFRADAPTGGSADCPVADLHGEIRERRFYGRRVIDLWREDGGPVEEAVDRIGHVPLPPYIRRPDTAADRERYQTVYARARGSVAAPTAGLHFTTALLEAIEARGVEVVEITLHVGYGTFKPVRAERIEDHVVDAEPYELDAGAAAALNRARDERRRLIAVGTTTTRALESALRSGGGRFRAGASRAELFIHPGFEFRAVGGLLTNFHLPRSSLLMLVAAFAGRESVLEAYRQAIDRGYRFYSYGDAMLIL